MRPKPRDSSHPKIFQSPAAAAAAASVTAAYALTKAENLDFKQLNDMNVKPTENGRPRDVTVKVESFEKEKQVLESSLAEVKAENSKLRGEIDEVNNTHAELSKVCNTRLVLYSSFLSEIQDPFDFSVEVKEVN